MMLLMLICCERKILFHSWLILIDKLKRTEPDAIVDAFIMTWDLQYFPGSQAACLVSGCKVLGVTSGVT
jgi:hypothetical protein